MLDIVLVNPEIPQNTGSIARLCAATGIGLHLVGQLGFAVDDKHLKRAGLDYWKEVCLGIHRDLDTFLGTIGDRPFYLLSKKAPRSYAEVRYRGDEVFIFGPESVGLPEAVLARYEGQALRIPIRDRVRSLNLAAAVHVVTYHALAQLGFPGIP
jgi:tRNA (cytidine/uridine-2'-O-)-methyltransferase